VISVAYKLRTQGGAVHVSPNYTANEIDSRLIVECVRWIPASLLRIFVHSNSEEIAAIVRSLARFPQSIIRQYDAVPMLQSVMFTTEEEILAHLLNAGEDILIAVIPKSVSGVRSAVKSLFSARSRQVVQRAGRWLITDLGLPGSMTGSSRSWPRGKCSTDLLIAQGNPAPCPQ
jgi:hypothetical protein